MLPVGRSRLFGRLESRQGLLVPSQTVEAEGDAGLRRAGLLRIPPRELVWIASAQRSWPLMASASPPSAVAFCGDTASARSYVRSARSNSPVRFNAIPRPSSATRLRPWSSRTRSKGGIASANRRSSTARLAASRSAWEPIIRLGSGRLSAPAVVSPAAER